MPQRDVSRAATPLPQNVGWLWSHARVCVCARARVSRPHATTGYTPLHMASGYMHTTTMAALLEAGADPLIKDKQGVAWLRLRP